MKKTILYLFFLLICYNLSIGQKRIIAQGDEWHYYDKEKAPPENWTKNNSSTDLWKTGVSPLGYGDSVVVTNINYGDDPKNKHITKYFKKSFMIEDPFEYLGYRLNIQMDDGIVVYLNGREIMRRNMPVGKITDSTKANGLIVYGVTEGVVHSKLIPPEDLISGINVFSASVHQAKQTSVDCIFNLEFIGEKNPELLSSILKERTLKNFNLNLKIKELENKLILEKKELKIESLQQVKTNYKYSFYVTFVMLLTAFLGFLYFVSHCKKKNTLLSKTISKLKNLDFNKNQELMNYSLNAIKNQQFLKETKRNLEEVVSQEADNLSKEIKKIIRQIDYNIENDDDWLLLNHFNVLHKGYIDLLTKKHATLSDTELRHCVFIKLHMQTKEIAQILHIDPRSVQAARYRIKKKMNLSETVDLRHYLQEL